MTARYTAGTIARWFVAWDRGRRPTGAGSGIPDVPRGSVGERYSGRLPMVGVRAGDVFHIVRIEAASGELYSHG